VTHPVFDFRCCISSSLSSLPLVNASVANVTVLTLHLSFYGTDVSKKLDSRSQRLDPLFSTALLPLSPHWEPTRFFSFSSFLVISASAGTRPSSSTTAFLYFLYTLSKLRLQFFIQHIAVARRQTLSLVRHAQLMCPTFPFPRRHAAKNNRKPLRPFRAAPDMQIISTVLPPQFLPAPPQNGTNEFPCLIA